MGHHAQEEHYRQVFGPFVAGEYAIGDMVTFDQGSMKHMIDFGLKGGKRHRERTDILRDLNRSGQDEKRSRAIENRSHKA